jgi:hypothetical protein
MALRLSQPPLPIEQTDRIDLVGVTVWGRDYRGPMAEALGIGKTLFWQLRKGESRRNVDAELIQLLDAQCDAAAVKSLEIAALRSRFLAERWQP